MSDIRTQLLTSARKFNDVKKLPTPFLGVDVHCRVMSGSERDSYEASRHRRVGDEYELDLSNTRAKLLVRTLCDDKGVRIFQDGDAEELGKADSRELDAAYEFASKMNGLDAESRRSARKNSGTTAS